MRKSVKHYSAKFKVKVVLDSLKGEETTSQLSAKYDTVPRNIQAWRKQFIENAELAFAKEKVIIQRSLSNRLYTTLKNMVMLH